MAHRTAVCSATGGLDGGFEAADGEGDPVGNQAGIFFRDFFFEGVNLGGRSCVEIKGGGGCLFRFGEWPGELGMWNWRGWGTGVGRGRLSGGWRACRGEFGCENP